MVRTCDEHNNGPIPHSADICDAHNNGLILHSAVICDAHNNGLILHSAVIWDAHNNGLILHSAVICGAHDNGPIPRSAVICDVQTRSIWSVYSPTRDHTDTCYSSQTPRRPGRGLGSGSICSIFTPEVLLHVVNAPNSTNTQPQVVMSEALQTRVRGEVPCAEDHSPRGHCLCLHLYSYKWPWCSVIGAAMAMQYSPEYMICIWKSHRYVALWNSALKYCSVDDGKIANQWQRRPRKQKVPPLKWWLLCVIFVLHWYPVLL